MISPEAAATAIDQLELMAFFPTNAAAHAALIRILVAMVETEDQLEWLIDRALKLYARWPGAAELRALYYCSRWKPKDGIETHSTIYPDGIPSAKETR